MFEYRFMNFLAPGISASFEVGVAVGGKGKVMAFTSKCVGLKTDVDIEGDVVVGVWKNLESITGTVYSA